MPVQPEELPQFPEVDYVVPKFGQIYPREGEIPCAKRVWEGQTNIDSRNPMYDVIFQRKLQLGLSGTYCSIPSNPADRRKDLGMWISHVGVSDAQVSLESDAEGRLALRGKVLHAGSHMGWQRQRDLADLQLHDLILDLDRNVGLAIVQMPFNLAADPVYIPMFDLDSSKARPVERTSDGKLVLRGLSIFFSSEAADVFDEAFGGEAGVIIEGAHYGELTVTVWPN